MDDEEYYQLDLDEEKSCYDALVREGGRPSHPAEYGRDIIAHPGVYQKILSYWQKGENDWMVFSRQLGIWRQFLRLQRQNREGDSFGKYATDTKKRLVAHGFTRFFQLRADPEQQDKLTTWIEFLGYQYRLYDKDMGTFERHKPLYDMAWEKLVKSQVLRPGETEEYVCSVESSFQQVGERQRAEEEVESVTALGDAEILAAALSKLDAIKRRDNLISEFHDSTKKMQIARCDAEHRLILLEWALMQIPVIEQEMQLSTANNDSGAIKPGWRTSKRRIANQSDYDGASKRRKYGIGMKETSSSRTYTNNRGDVRPGVRFDGSDRKVPQRLHHNSRVPTGARRTVHLQQVTGREPVAVDMDLDGEWPQGKQDKRDITYHDSSKLRKSPLRRSMRIRKPPDRFQ